MSIYVIFILKDKYIAYICQILTKQIKIKITQNKNKNKNRKDSQIKNIKEIATES